jgi:predicted TIM-barrel fold metal-dependent hydrolase
MTMPQYLQASDAWHVSDVVFCEVSADPTDWLKEAKWVQGLADGPTKSSPTKIGAILAQPPPGFGTAPVASYSADLDQLQKEVRQQSVRSTSAPTSHQAAPRHAVDAVRRGPVRL